MVLQTRHFVDVGAGVTPRPGFRRKAARLAAAAHAARPPSGVGGTSAISDVTALVRTHIDVITTEEDVVDAYEEVGGGTLQQFLFALTQHFRY